ncbi:hypothetical protein OMP38_18175 [Cohnella ginsengisoli]|uniref:Uncharacterized protein n=1 Tax=Cohnella ginsengisoli TaxID=425004 RepID=A0A9X4QMY4_9BACL|nr:hypothetical protein [Cohnella ginsengisoli]MDG0792589.1 hypothetical protein [Cohnella ginsengisoli]
MVNNLLLQVLIALLPVGTFQVWFSRQRQLRHSRLFIGIVSGLCMLLGHVYMIQNGPVILDLGFVAVITASLYGGFPFAVVLSAGFLALKIPGEEPAEIAGFFVFFLVYLLILYKVSRTFRLKGRVAKMRSVAILWAVATLSFFNPRGHVGLGRQRNAGLAVFHGLRRVFDRIHPHHASIRLLHRDRLRAGQPAIAAARFDPSI